jgi:hypothetical protein
VVIVKASQCHRIESESREIQIHGLWLGFVCLPESSSSSSLSQSSLLKAPIASSLFYGRPHGRFTTILACFKRFLKVSISFQRRNSFDIII